jgi:hypothetical protein
MASFEGGCLCGAVRYRVAAVPLWSGLCHCVSCRRAHAAAAVPWITVPSAALTWTQGAATPYRSSPHVVRGFCNVCGTQLSYARDDNPVTLDIAALSLDDPEAFPPTAETWLSDKLSWQSPAPGFRHFERGSA